MALKLNPELENDGMEAQVLCKSRNLHRMV